MLHRVEGCCKSKLSVTMEEGCYKAKKWSVGRQRNAVARGRCLLQWRKASSLKINVALLAYLKENHVIFVWLLTCFNASDHSLN